MYIVQQKYCEIENIPITPTKCYAWDETVDNFKATVDECKRKQ